MLNKLVVLALLVYCATGWSIPPTFVVDLSVAPRQRWAGSVNLILSRHSYNESFAAFFVNFKRDQVDMMSAVDKQAIVESVKANFPTHYEEVSGIADQFEGIPEAAYVSPDFLALWMWFHELAHAPGMVNRKECTGVLVLPKDVALPIFHARNLDQDFHTARNATLHVVFKNTATHGDEILYEGTCFYWTSSGLVTMQRTDGFTFEENWMFETIPMSQIVNRIVNQNATPQVLQFRQFLSQMVSQKQVNTLSTPSLFQFALNYFLHDTTFAAGQYVVFSATGRKGGVLSLSFNTEKNKIEVLQDSDSTTSDEGWFLVQTNYNRSLPDPANDPRRTVAVGALKSLGPDQGASSLGAWLVVTQVGVSVADTEFSCLMTATRVPGTPVFSCVVRAFRG